MEWINILKAKPGIDLEDLSKNDLIRLCVGAVAEHEDIKDPAELAELARDLRRQGGPTFRGDGMLYISLEIGLLGWEYILMDTDLAEDEARTNVTDFAYEQYDEVVRQLDDCGISSTYVQFDTDMFIRDCMIDWGCWLGSYDDVVNEYFPQTIYNGLVENFGSFSIWRVS